MTDKNAVLSGPFYHGTKADLKRGDVIATGPKPSARRT